MYIQVAASARLAAYAAKAAADSLAPGDVGAVVSAAVAALTQQAADNAAAAVQDKSSSAAAAAAVEAVNSAAGAKRQRFMMSEAALRPNLVSQCLNSMLSVSCQAGSCLSHFTHAHLLRLLQAVILQVCPGRSGTHGTLQVAHIRLMDALMHSKHEERRLVDC